MERFGLHGLGLGLLVAVVGCDGRTVQQTTEAGPTSDGGPPAHDSGAGGARGAGDGGAIATGAGGAQAGAGGAHEAGGGAGRGGAGGNDEGGTDATSSGGTMGGGPFRDSGSASTGGRTSLPAGKWRLERAAVNVPWNIGQSTYGIAVDSHNRVYFAAGEVYLFDGTKVSTYLTAAEVVAASDAGDSEFDDLDIGPADTLYVLFGGELFTSNAAHQVVRWGNTRRGGYHDHLGVVKTDSLAYVGYDGLSMLMRKSSKNVYAGSELGLEQDCACQDFSIVPSGVFLYEPGCNGSGINRGNIDGSGVGVLFRATGAAPTYANNFICNGRDPLGGFYVLTENLSAGGRLLHFTEDATEAAGVVTIDTTPAVSAAAGQDDGLFAFDYCSVAGAPDGSAYIATGSTLWHAIPP